MAFLGVFVCEMGVMRVPLVGTTQVWSWPHPGLGQVPSLGPWCSNLPTVPLLSLALVFPTRLWALWRQGWVCPVPRSTWHVQAPHKKLRE